MSYKVVVKMDALPVFRQRGITSCQPTVDIHLKNMAPIHREHKSLVLLPSEIAG